MGRLYDIIQGHIDAQAPYPPSVRQVALQLGVSPTTVANWRHIKQVPKREHLEALARVTGTPLQQVFEAAIFDAGLMIENEVPVTEEQLVAGMESGQIAARKRGKR